MSEYIYNLEVNNEYISKAPNPSIILEVCFQPECSPLRSTRLQAPTNQLCDPRTWGSKCSTCSIIKKYQQAGGGSVRSYSPNIKMPNYLHTLLSRSITPLPFLLLSPSLRLPPPLMLSLSLSLRGPFCTALCGFVSGLCSRRSSSAAKSITWFKPHLKKKFCQLACSLNIWTDLSGNYYREIAHPICTFQLRENSCSL